MFFCLFFASLAFAALIIRFPVPMHLTTTGWICFIFISVASVAIFDCSIIFFSFAFCCHYHISICISNYRIETIHVLSYISLQTAHKHQPFYESKKKSDWPGDVIRCCWRLGYMKTFLFFWLSCAFKLYYCACYIQSLNAMFGHKLPHDTAFFL